jgi:intracellular septation protein
MWMPFRWLRDRNDVSMHPFPTLLYGGGGFPMKNFLQAAKPLLFDMASTLFFVGLYFLTKNTLLSVTLGVALGVCQVGWELTRKRPVAIMQWFSLFVVAASGAAALVTHNPSFILIKPSIFYAAAGIAMLKRGWMAHYMPPVAMDLVPDLVVVFGFIWAAMMFASAAVNIGVAFLFGIGIWSMVMPVFGIVTKVGLFLIQYATMRFIGRRRRLAMPATALQSAQSVHA